MGFITQAFRIGPKLIGYKLAKVKLAKAPMPINFTFSITHACQSLCKTCNIGLVHRKHPEKVKNELKIDEIEKVFRSIGKNKVYFFNISGGEPFLRPDIDKIIELAIKYLRPAIIHTPTNALTPALIEKKVRKIMEIIEKESPQTHFTIKPSYDAVGKKHDVIRGVEGNWEKLMDTITRLKEVRKDHPNLYVGIGTVISNFSIVHLKETVEFSKTLGVDSYISEVAEQRAEMTNVTDPITPSWKKYEEAIEFFKNESRQQMKSKPLLSRVTLSMRLVYYDLCIQILKQKTQVIPCYGGISNAHMNAYGDMWPCAILAYSKNMGNVRDFDYDFKKIWNKNVKTKEIRKYIHDKKCHCPLANQTYSNILLDPKSLLKSIKNMIFG
ncbi:radical SAM protein [archaeon]|jgi:MoaA/NifB/PqqE/SkfB family radical SAM enzyme|nr:radical SAM protein [Candidatus Woesearchaeota archaeon]MBT3464353.1 radical SAM protein [archaeon]MBT4647983.1 radical SAM protein [archaeon]MBT6822648.1 radical SAM protein [archaeon]MBT7391555.1 radical SAM protein [archaeon]